MPETDLDYAKLTGRFAVTKGDGPDAGENPDTVYCTEGEVHLRPLVGEVKVVGGADGPFTTVMQTIVAVIGDDGRLRYYDQPYVWVPDLTSPKVNPQVAAEKATHEVTFVGVKAGDLDVTLGKRYVRITKDGPDGDGVNDLTRLSPLSPGAATPMFRGPEGPEGPAGPGASDEDVAGYVTDPESATYAGLADSFVAIPAGGEPGQVLVLLEDGTVGWGEGSGEAPSNVPTQASSGPGWRIPANSLDNYRTTKTAAKAGTALLELSLAGDSLTAGTTNNYAAGAAGRYAYATRLRDLFPTKSIPDGGHGHVNGTWDSPSVSGEPSGIGLVTNFSGNGNAGYLLPGDPVISNTVGETATWTVRHTHLRAFYTRLFTMGRFRWRLDGGAWTIEEGYSNDDTRFGIIDLPGLADTTHTLEVENLGGRTWAAPTGLFAATEGSVGPAAGTYYYVVTGNTPDGETTVSNTVTATVNGSQGVRLNTPNNGYNPGTYKVYRSTSPSGPFNYLATAAALGNGSCWFLDDGTASTTGTTPPTGPNPIDDAPTHCNIAVDSMKDAGAVVHNFGVNGMRASELTDPDMMVMLGLVTSGSGAAIDQPKDSRPGARRPSASVFGFGANDMGLDVIANQGEADARAAALKAKAKAFCQASRAADCDPIIMAWPLEMWTANKTYAQTFLDALDEAASEESAVWFYVTDAALGPASEWPALGYGNADDIHLSIAGYRKVAAELFAKVLAK